VTEQYQQNNINNPRGSRSVDGNLILTLDDDLVVADTSVDPVLLELPDARQIPGNTVYIKAPDGSTNAVTISGFAGQTIDGSATLVLNTDEASALLKSDGANWQLFLGGGGGGGFPETQQNGGTIVASTQIYNFTGAGVNVAGAGNTATVNIPGGAAAPLTQAFLDNVTTDITVGSITTDGCIVVHASISKVDGESTSYHFMFGVSPTGVGLTGFDCLQSDSDSPITDITPQAASSGPNVLLRLVGSGTGVQSGIAYTVQTIPRLLP